MGGGSTRKSVYFMLKQNEENQCGCEAHLDSGDAGASLRSDLAGTCLDLAVWGFNGKHSRRREQVPL